MSRNATLPNIQVKLKIKAKNLDKKDFLGLGHSDPFVVLKNSTTDETIYQTEYIKNNSKPEFDAFSLKLDQNTFEEPIHLKVYDWDKNGDHSFIGEFHANLAEIHQKDNKERTYVCNNDQKKKPYSGEVTLSILSLVEDKPKAMENIKEIINDALLKNEDATVMVWRVVDGKLEREDNTSHGTFFLGDSYVIYDKKKNFVYYWFGDESSKEEREKAEHVATQLCHHVDCGLMERLVKDAVTKEFAALFKNITFLHDDNENSEELVKSRENDRKKSNDETVWNEEKLEIVRDKFSQAELEEQAKLLGANGEYTKSHEKEKQEKRKCKNPLRKDEPKLFRLVGKNHIVHFEVGKIGWENMNHGDVFVLDCGPKIFVWVGEASNCQKKFCASQLADTKRNQIHEQIIQVVDGEEGEMEEEDRKVWEKYLPLNLKNRIKPACPQDDRKINREVNQEFSLYKCSDETGTFQSDLVKKGRLERSDLKTEDVFLVNAEELGVWVWQGKGSNIEEKMKAMQFGETLIKHLNMDSRTRLIKVFEGRECPQFKSLFARW